MAEDWNNLVDHAVYPNVFLRWEWVGTWWKWFGASRPLRVYSVYDGSQLVGILPLYARRRALCGISRRMVLAPIGFGGPTCPEYLGLIVHRQALEAVVQRLAAELRSPDQPWAAIELPDVAPDDRGTHALLEALAAEYPSVATPGVRCPAIFLPESYEALLGRLTSHRRQREKAQLRKAITHRAARIISLDTYPEPDT
ncbi:MAG: GNAT family N-acetyltransferase, partial [Candidatus Oleimicrobiaceae bacterium]